MASAFRASSSLRLSRTPESRPFLSRRNLAFFVLTSRSYFVNTTTTGADYVREHQFIMRQMHSRSHGSSKERTLSLIRELKQILIPYLEYTLPGPRRLSTQPNNSELGLVTPLKILTTRRGADL